jgi:drug/metabolite transporter (DMT)-like permease
VLAENGRITSQRYLFTYLRGNILLLVALSLFSASILLADYWLKVGILAPQDVAKATLTGLSGLGGLILILWIERRGSNNSQE